MYVKNNHPQALSAGKTIIGFNWIGGKEVEGDLPSFDSRSAVDNRDTVGVFPECGERDVEKAIKIAHEAQKKWRLATFKERASVLTMAAENLTEHKERFSKVIAREVGLVHKAVKQEIGEALTAFGHAYHPHAAPTSGPLGVIGLLSPVVSPVASALRHMIPTLLAGNTIVWKPSSNAPASAYLLARCLMDAELPSGVVNIVNGKGHAACGKAMISALDKGLFQGFSFAGSQHAAGVIAKSCGKNLVPFFAEAHGGGLMIVMPDADLKQCIEAACRQMVDRNGQGCLSLSNILVHKDIENEFREDFLKALSKLTFGNPLSHHDVHCGPLASHRIDTAFEEHWEAGSSQGATLITGGQKWTQENRQDQVLGEIGRSLHFQPCVWAVVKPEMPLFSRSVEGPSINLCTVENLEEALSHAQNLHRPSQCSLWTACHDSIQQFQSAMSAGILLVNADLPNEPIRQEPPSFTRRQGFIGFKPHILHLQKGKYPQTNWELL